MSPRPLFIGSEIHRRVGFDAKHPLAIPRVSTVVDLGRALGWLPDGFYLESPEAAPGELARFHDRRYIAVLKQAARDRRVTPEVGRRYNIGRLENPVYAEMFRRPATACGGSLLAARLLVAGRAKAVYNPAGGTHHGRPDRAAGFCYFNDPVLALLALLDGGLARISHTRLGLRGTVAPTGPESRAVRCGASGKRLDAPCRRDGAALRVAPRRPPTASRASTVASATLFDPLLAGRPPGRDADRGGCEKCGLARLAYVDVDAHHGDGVEDAFADEPRVLTVSVHEAGRWPHRAGRPERQCPSVANFAVPPGFNDSEMRLIVDRAIVPLVAGFRPEAVVMQCGADALADDPLSRLELSNNALVHAVRAVAAIAPRLLLLGGGGYNPWSVARCWTRNWAALNDAPGPPRLPAAAEAVLRRLTWSRRAGRNPPAHWFTGLIDPPREGPIRDAVRATVERALAA